MADLSADPLLTTPCRVPDLGLRRGRLRLFPHAVQLTGWTLKGRYRRRIPLHRIERVEWLPVTEGPNLVLHLCEDAPINLVLLKAAGTWKFELQALLGAGADTLNKSLPEEEKKKDLAA